MTVLNTDPWATLPPNWRDPAPLPTPSVPVRYYRPLPEMTKLPDVTCRPHCRRCHHPEGRGSCRRCVIVCDHTKKTRLVEVCIVRTRAAATERRGGTGRAHILVHTCPHCGHAHTHSTEPAHPYRRAGCGQPYLLETR